MSNQIIASRELVKEYRRGSESVHALRGINFTLDTGEFTAIVGPSGSGKSTLLQLLGLLETPTKGSIMVTGVEVGKLHERDLVKLRRGNMGFVFQQFLLLPTLTVKENMELPLLFNRSNGRRTKVEELLDLLELSHRADHLPHQLSGGEMQRVSIGRALVNEPKVLLADEPTGNLDSVTSEKIYGLFRKLNNSGLSLIVVTHNMELASIAHRVVRLRDGRVD